MKIVKLSLVPLLICILLSSFLLSGCGGILTQSQINEIKKFSLASDSYSNYPTAVMNAHSKFRLHNKLANASSATNGQNALNFVKTGLKNEKEFTKLADQADKSCQVLRTYSEILNRLSSDVYTASTQASLEKLAKELDNSITGYNKISGTSLKAFGSAVAAIVRGAGSIYIKHKQYKAIKEAVSKADPVIELMIASIIELLDTYHGDSGLQLIEAEREYLEDWYKESGYKQPLATSVWVAEDLKEIESALLLAGKSKQAAKMLRKAHATLTQNIQKPMDLKGAIEAIETMVEEVETAKEFKDKLDGKP